ncbi:lytic transglycosylase domain-containing protein [Undibacterium sp. NL8W]|uniref:Lytic transglycosylase domain-containing protein n=2 Tax=Undibacterium umbellatum TaxID=2762300 RepID=A0ABR6ZGD3_9BURK|nr:lytic transglycosylase domain-containing protein [Undibacterium umbellatum]
MLIAISQATTAILAAIAAALAAVKLALLTVINYQILPETAAASAKVVAAYETQGARNKVGADGEAATMQGKAFLFGSQVGLPGSTPRSPQEAVSATLIKNTGVTMPSKVCNELVGQTQVTSLVSSGAAIATDAMNTRLVNSMRTSRMSDAEASYHRHASSYCTLSDVFNGICDAAAADHLQNLDVMPPGYIRDGESKTTQLSEEEKRAAMVWTENVLGMGNYPATDYSEDTYNSDARKAFSGSNNVIQARMSTVAHSLNSQIARRSKVVVAFNADNSARADVANQIADANPNLDPSSTTTGTAETQARCAASADFAKYEKMGTAAVNTAINNSFANGDSGSPLLNFGISLSAWHYYAYVESTKNPNAVSPAKYYGLYQMGAGALSDVGMSGLLPTQIFDPYQNGIAAKKYAIANIAAFSSTFPKGVKGVPPVFVLYGMHNMGASGFKQIYDNITTGAPLSAARKKAIQGNMSPRVPLDQINGQMYWEFWRKKFGINAC